MTLTWAPAEGPDGPAPSVTVAEGKLVWHLDADHDFKIGSRHDEQTVDDFIHYRPAWAWAPSDVVERLIAHLGLQNPPWLQPGFEPYSAAWRAIEKNDEARALELIPAEDPLRIYRHGVTLLMFAADHGMTNAIGKLIEAGADVNARDDRGSCALVHACTAPLDAARQLIDAGADQLDEAAFMAIVQGNQRVAELLIERGAQPGRDRPWLILDVARRGWMKIVKAMLEARVSAVYQNGSGWTAVMCARDPELVWFLLEAGANPDLKNNEEETALTMACRNGEDWKVKLLLDAGANPNVTMGRANISERGKTVLGSMIEWGKHPRIVGLLILNGADPNATQPSGKKPIHYAILNGDVRAVEMLISAKADIRAIDDWGRLPLATAKDPRIRELLGGN
jgi:ankyrin repeat protein